MYLTILLNLGGDFIVNKDGIRKDLLMWRLKEVRTLAEEYEKVFNVLLELLSDRDPRIRANSLQVIKEMVDGGTLPRERVAVVLEKVQSLVKDKDERVALKALEVLNSFLERGLLTDEEYESVTATLMDVLKSGVPVLGEYAAEGLGKVGSRIAKIAYRLIGWLFSLIGSSKKREVQSAAITALTEMASNTGDTKVLNEIFDRMSDLVTHPDPYIAERAILSVDRLLSRADALSMRNKLKAIEKLKSLRGNVQLGVKASQILEKLEKTASAVSEEGFTTSRTLEEVTKYGLDDVGVLLDSGKPEIVAEMAKLDPQVMDMVLNMLSDPDYTRRMDALWIVARVVDHIPPSNAYAILPVLSEFLKSRNPWARETAASVLADLYSLYPGTSKFLSSLVDLMLKSKKPIEVEGALELLIRLSDKIGGEQFEKSVLKVLFKLMDDTETRQVVLRFLAREAQRLLDMNTETLLELKDKLKSLYGADGGKNDEIIASLIDVIDDILHLRRRGLVAAQG